MRSVVELLHVNHVEFVRVYFPSQKLNLFFAYLAFLWLVFPIQTDDRHGRHSIHPAQISPILLNIQRYVHCFRYSRLFVWLSLAEDLHPTNDNFVSLLCRVGLEMLLRIIPNFLMLDVDRISCILLCSHLVCIHGFWGMIELCCRLFYMHIPKLFPEK